jgi:putative FmdB family regulatory protein
MPIFEYKCEDCSSVFEILHKSSNNNEDVFCPNCKSLNYKKLISVFSAKSSGSAPDFGGCSDGSCSMPQYGGGCANGMCGLN